MGVYRLSNDEVADTLEQVAELLQTQAANPFRVRAYREAGRTIRSLERSAVSVYLEAGRSGLEALPGIGRSIASAIEELIHTGSLRLLERLAGEVSPEDLFTTVSGIGEALAHRLHRELVLDTLEELELAAHDGRLERMAGFGASRTRMVRDALGAMLSRSSRRRARLIRRRERHDEDRPFVAPPVGLLLGVDSRYRRLAAEGKLKTIAPRRFNPEGARWLPVLHVDEQGWSFTAMFSNTARAHELGRTRDWVVIYYEKEGYEDQCTVVTETGGSLKGHRVVRGREAECARGA